MASLVATLLSQPQIAWGCLLGTKISPPKFWDSYDKSPVLKTPGLLCYLLETDAE